MVENSVTHCYHLFSRCFTSNRAKLKSVDFSDLKGYVKKEVERHLACSFTVTKVKLPLKHIAPIKALGPYGVCPFFFQQQWCVIGNDECNVFLSTRLIVTSC